MSTRTASNVEPCSAEYRAVEVPGSVTIFAVGTHHTTGYNVFFEQSPIDVFPPEFTLWHTKPAGAVLQVITPFTAHISFGESELIEKVIVHDASGRHEVAVEQVTDHVRLHSLSAARVPGNCLSFLTASEIVEAAVGPENFDLEKRLGQLYASPSQRDVFRERVFDGVLANGCSIQRGQIPNGEDDTLRVVRDTIKETAS